MKKVLVIKVGSNVVAENGGVSRSALKLIADKFYKRVSTVMMLF